MPYEALWSKGYSLEDGHSTPAEVLRWGPVPFSKDTARSQQCEPGRGTSPESKHDFRALASATLQSHCVWNVSHLVYHIFCNSTNGLKCEGLTMVTFPQLLPRPTHILLSFVMNMASHQLRCLGSCCAIVPWEAFGNHDCVWSPGNGWASRSDAALGHFSRDCQAMGICNNC